MAYGDRLRVRVRSTGDFRFENKLEDGIEEVGLILNGSIELSMDDLHQALELDTRGISVRQFDGHQWYVDAGADSAALDFIVNVAADVSVLGLTGTVAYVRSRLRRAQQSNVQRLAAILNEDDFETVARQVLRSKFGVSNDNIRIDSVEWTADGEGVVQASVPEGNRQFQVDLRLHGDGIRLYRVRRTNLS